METNNDFRQILQDKVFSEFDQINLFLIKYKWEHHTELMIDEIKKSLCGQRKFNYITVDEERGLPLNQRTDAKVRQIRNQLTDLYK